MIGSECCILLILFLTLPTTVSQIDSWGKLSAGISSNEVSQGALTVPAGFQCRVCEDVAATWRHTFQCVGMGENDLSPRITEDGPGCLPTSNCNQFKGSLKASCEDLQKSLRSSADQSGRIDAAIHEEISSYNICGELGYCPVQSTKEGADCAGALDKYDCNDDIECKSAREVCDDTCFACFWQVRVWPTFQSECKRAVGGSKPPPNGPAPKLRRLRRLLMTPGLGSPPIDPQPPNAKSPADLGKMCWDTWDIFEKSAKARFLTGMVDQLGNLPWEANTVCKCLGICAYDEFEGIQLLSACDWHDDDPAITAALFPDIAPKLNAAIRDGKPLTSPLLTAQDKRESDAFWNGA